MTYALLAFGLAYLIGSFPSAYIVAKLRGADIFAVGSGNMGAMNTARNLGYGLGALVLVLDASKGALATYIGLLLSSAPTPLLPALAASVGVVIGHAASLFTGFKGGKALATAFGVALVLYPLAGLVSLVILVGLTLALKKRSALAAVSAVVLHPFVVFLVTQVRYGDVGRSTALFASVAIIAAIIIVKYLPSLRQETVALKT